MFGLRTLNFSPDVEINTISVGKTRCLSLELKMGNLIVTLRYLRTSHWSWAVATKTH